MEKILDDLSDIQSNNIANYKFIGKLAVASWKYDGAVNYLKYIRILIGIMGLIMLYPVLINYLFLDFFSMGILIERLILCTILLFCFGIYNRFRLAALIIALLPIALLLFISLTNLEYFSVKQFGFNGAVFLLVIGGIYYHFKEKKLGLTLKDALINKHPDAILKKR